MLDVKVFHRMAHGQTDLQLMKAAPSYIPDDEPENTKGKDRQRKIIVGDGCWSDNYVIYPRSLTDKQMSDARFHFCESDRIENLLAEETAAAVNQVWPVHIAKNGALDQYNKPTQGGLTVCLFSDGQHTGIYDARKVSAIVRTWKKPADLDKVTYHVNCQDFPTLVVKFDGQTVSALRGVSIKPRSDDEWLWDISDWSMPTDEEQTMQATITHDNQTIYMDITPEHCTSEKAAKALATIAFGDPRDCTVEFPDGSTHHIGGGVVLPVTDPEPTNHVPQQYFPPGKADIKIRTDGSWEVVNRYKKTEPMDEQTADPTTLADISAELVTLRKQTEAADMRKAKLLQIVKRDKLYKDPYGTFACFCEHIGYSRGYAYDLIAMYSFLDARTETAAKTETEYASIGAMACKAIASAAKILPARQIVKLMDDAKNPDRSRAKIAQSARDMVKVHKEAVKPTTQERRRTLNTRRGKLMAQIAKIDKELAALV